MPENDLAKTIRGRGASIMTRFSAREPAIFRTAEATDLLDIPARETYAVLGALVRRGWIVRVRRGVYEVPPLWATRETGFTSDRFASLPVWLMEPYYIGFLSAFEVHGWLRQPVIGRVIIATPRQFSLARIGGDTVTWVRERSDRFAWGIDRRWFGSASVPVSDPERTILDSLHLPRHAGGVIEVATVLAQAWSDLDLDRLATHAERLGIAAATRRLGVLLETMDLSDGRAFANHLHSTLKRAGAPSPLDPSMPSGGEVDRRWGIEVNLDREEIAGAGQT